MDKVLQKSKIIILIAQITVILILAGSIEYIVSSGKVSELYLASPTQVISGLKDIINKHELFSNLLVTLQEFSIGFLSALVSGIVLGVILGTVNVLERFFKPFFSALMAIPKVAIMPMLIVWFGIGLLSKVVMVFLTCFFPVLYNTISGIKQTNENYLKVAKVFEATKLQTTFKILIPSAIPTIFASIRVCVATGIVGALFSEMLASKNGLGHMLNEYSQTYATPKLFAGILIVTLIPVVLIFVIDFLEKKVFLKWKQV